MSEDVRSTISLYKRLFSLPSNRTLVMIIIFASLLVGGLTELLRYLGGGSSSGIIFLRGSARGLVITIPAALLTLLAFRLGTRKGTILNWHRLLGVVTTSVIVLLVIWFFSTLVGWAIELIFKFQYGPLAGGGIATMFYLRNLILAAAFTSAIMLLIALSTSRVGVTAGLLLSLVFPTTAMAMYVLTEPVPTQSIFLIIYFLCAITFVSASGILLTAVGRPLKKAFKIDGIQMFRGFLEVWMEDRADLMEESLTQIGQERILPLSLIKFSTDTKDPLFVKVVPGAHPGPFKNTGSSALPKEIGDWGRTKLNAIAYSPHSTSTHDLNLVSQVEVQRFMEMVQTAYEQATPIRDVSQFSRASSGTIQVGCQIFGDTAVLLITRSPIEMDDISLAVAEQIIAKLENRANRYIIIDTHNCMSELKESVHEGSKLIPDMIEAAKTAIIEASKTSRAKPRIGVAQRKDTGYTKVEGMGAEGITVSIVEVKDQKMAYVLIDGNNMIIGLREKIVNAIVPKYVDAAEIMTSDTHQTAAISASNGYSPIGELIPHEELTNLIIELIVEATNNLEPGNVALYQGVTEPLLVMGEGTVDKLTSLIPVSASIAKRLGITVYAIAFVISLFLLLFVLPFPL
jgi:putative membrane protein